MTVGDDTSDDLRDRLVREYMHLTRETLPDMAGRLETDWPVVNDHCFQRIVLDTISGGVWYDHIQRPAYKNLTFQQAKDAVALCHAISSGSADLYALNLQSLRWRGKAR
ncbi:hypothetical protein [Tateyamaria sp. SN6-1]|uniref:hypothetical protein n=1 Tax=Tateyamaria sp. SN6-1 TaxID=3092148 RepID=UPI0039F610B8